MQRTVIFLMVLSTATVGQSRPAAELAFGTWRLAAVSGGFSGGIYEPDSTYYRISVSRLGQDSAVLIATHHDTVCSTLQCDTAALIGTLIGLSFYPYDSWAFSIRVDHFNDSSYQIWDGAYDGYQYNYVKMAVTGIERHSVLSSGVSLNAKSSRCRVFDLTGRKSGAYAPGIVIRATGNQYEHASKTWTGKQ